MPENRLTPCHVLFLDTDCLFCQKSAQIVHRFDKRDAFSFASLKGITAEQIPEGWKLIDRHTSAAPSAVILAENLHHCVTWWRGADAALRTLKLLGRPWAYSWHLHHLPDWLKDGVYDFVAKNRHRITSNKKICKLSSAEYTKRMLP